MFAKLFGTSCLLKVTLSAKSRETHLAFVIRPPLVQVAPQTSPAAASTLPHCFPVACSVPLRSKIPTFTSSLAFLTVLSNAFISQCQGRPWPVNGEHYTFFTPSCSSCVETLCVAHGCERRSHTVVVPYCSSDMWLGASNGPDPDSGLFFHGRRIVHAVLRDLTRHHNLSHADVILLIGNSGMVSLLPELLPLLPTTATVLPVCDGCVLLDSPSYLSPSRFPLKDMLTSALPVWGVSERLPLCSIPTPQCLFGTYLLPRLSNITTRFLVQQPQWDTFQLTVAGAGVPTRDNAAFRSDFAAHIRSLVAPLAGAFVVASACPAPITCTLTGCTYHTQVAFVDGSGSASLIVALGVMVNDLDRPPMLLIDRCTTFECNPSCQQ